MPKKAKPKSKPDDKQDKTELKLKRVWLNTPEQLAKNIGEKIIKLLEQKNTRIAELEEKQKSLVDIETFCRWLERQSYLDCDWWAEKPTVLQRWAEHIGKPKEEQT